MSLNRVVAFLTPVFAAVAGVGSAWLARHFPGIPPLPPADIVAFEITAATTAAGAALKWLHGSQLAERYVHEGEQFAKSLHLQATESGLITPDQESAVVAQLKAEAVTLRDQLIDAVEGRKAAIEAGRAAQSSLANTQAQFATAGSVIVTPAVPDAPKNAQPV